MLKKISCPNTIEIIKGHIFKLLSYIISRYRVAPVVFCPEESYEVAL